MSISCVVVVIVVKKIGKNCKVYGIGRSSNGSWSDHLWHDSFDARHDCQLTTRSLLLSNTPPSSLSVYVQRMHLFHQLVIEHIRTTNGYNFLHDI